MKRTPYMVKQGIDMDKSAILAYYFIMSEKLGTFFDPEVQRLIDSFAYCFRVKITVFSPDMEELIVGLQNPGAHYCSLIQNSLKIRYRCCRQDKLMCESCNRHKRLMVYRCHGGLSESVLPMEIDGTLIGYAMLGQFRTTDTIPTEMRAEWKSAKLNDDALTSAFLGQPYFDETSLNKMLHLFTMMISFVNSRDYVRVRRAEVVESVIYWLEAHISEPAELETVADAVSRSCSTVSHAVKRQLGMSFKQLASLKKIQKFESMIARNPLLSVQEAARAVGYDDPLYFSRLYKKVRLSPPSVYVQSLRDSAIKIEKFSTR